MTIHLFILKYCDIWKDSNKLSAIKDTWSTIQHQHRHCCPTVQALLLSVLLQGHHLGFLLIWLTLSTQHLLTGLGVCWWCWCSSFNLYNPDFIKMLDAKVWCIGAWTQLSHPRILFRLQVASVNLKIVKASLCFIQQNTYKINCYLLIILAFQFTSCFEL